MKCAQGSPHQVVGILVASTFDPGPDEVVRIGSEMDVAINHEKYLLANLPASRAIPAVVGETVKEGLQEQ